MSGSTPKVLGASTSVTGAALLPNTGGSRIVFWVALVALAFGLITLAISGVVALKQRLNKA